MSMADEIRVLGERLREVTIGLNSSVGIVGLLSENLVADPSSASVPVLAVQLSESCEQLIFSTRRLNELLESVEEQRPVAGPPASTTPEMSSGPAEVGAPTSPDTLRYANLELDHSTGTASANGQPLPLSRSEFTVLAALLDTPAQLVPYEHLVRELWGEPVAAQRRRHDLQVVIAGLRRRLDPNCPAAFSRIQNLRAEGYRFVSRPAGRR